MHRRSEAHPCGTARDGKADLSRFHDAPGHKLETPMLLEGKKGLIIGVANKHSIAWAIAQSVSNQGAHLLFNYQNERLRENVEELVATMPGTKAFPCDVGQDTEIAALMQHVEKEFGRLDFLVHSLAFAPREELTGEFVNTTRQGFATALDVSAYSLVAVTRAAVPLM